MGVVLDTWYKWGMVAGFTMVNTRGLIQVGVNAAGSSKKKPSASGWPRAAAGAGAAGGARPVY
jgi:hypothetical protein